MSSNYWKDREDEALAHYIKEEAEYDKELRKIYLNMLDACQNDIDGFYSRYATAEGISIADAKKRVTKLNIAEYERKAARYVKAAAADRKANGGVTLRGGEYFSKKANEEMRLYNATMKINRLEMLKANIGLELLQGHIELDKFMEEILQGRTMDELARQAGILGKTVKNNARLANVIVNASFHNATFSDRVWQYQDLMREDLSRLIQQGLIQGKSSRALAKDLRKYLVGDKNGKGASYNMQRLMRTELARVQTEAQKQSFIRNGFSHYEYLANSGCCDICKDLDGEHFKVSEMMPGENAPPMHPHCRCSTAAWEDDEEYEAWLNYLEQGGTTEEWNRNRQSIYLAANKYYANRAHKTKTETDLLKVSKSSIIDLENYGELVSYFQSKYGIAVVGFEKKSLFEVKCVLAGVDDMLSRFKDANAFVNSITYNAHKKTYGGINRLGKLEVGPKGLGDYGTGLHECAHALDYARSSYNTNSYSDGIVEAVRKKLKLRKKEYEALLFGLTGLPDETRSFEIFAYAMESELGGNSNALSKAILKEVEGE